MPSLLPLLEETQLGVLGAALGAGAAVAVECSAGFATGSLTSETEEIETALLDLLSRLLVCQHGGLAWFLEFPLRIKCSG